MLSSAKPKLEKDIEDILYKALYKAQNMVFEPGGSEPMIDNFIKNTIDKTAKEYAKTAAKEAAKPLAEAIYNFVKEIGIVATPKALISPHGPVIGTININEFKIT